MRLSLRIYRALLRLYPAGFRERFGGPLQRDFEDESADLRRTRDLARLWAHTLADLARSIPIQVAEEFRQDAHHAVRLWRRSPVSTAFVVVVLAIATGASTGVFSVLNALLLRSLPFREPDRLVTLHMFTLPGPPDNAASFHAWRSGSAYLQDAAKLVTSEVTLDGSPEAQRIQLAETSWNFFELLGTAVAPGRGFVPGEDLQGQSAVAVISHGLWSQRFGEDPGAIGATIRLNGAPFAIVGVAPAGFDYPQKTQVWTPTTFDWQRVSKTGVVFWRTIGRLRPGLAWGEATRAFEREAYERSPDRRTADIVNRPALISLQAQLAGPIRNASLMLMAGVALLLLLACANVANLLLSRTVSRSNELRIRTALGASRARLAQQLFTETLLLSGLAALSGLLVAGWTARLAAAAQPPAMSSQSYAILDWRVLGFTLAVALATGLVFGMGPALYSSRPDAGLAGRTTPTRRRTRMGQALVAIQIALTIVLLTSSLALGRAFLALLRVDNGYEVRSLATMTVSFAGTSYAGADRSLAYYAEVARRVRDIPGVVAVSATESLPLNVDSFMGGRYGVDQAVAATDISTVTFVAPAFFNTIGSRLVAGREFSANDLRDPQPMAIVSEEFARAFGDPAAVVGRSLVSGRGNPRRIIGVVPGLRYGGPASKAGPQIFWLSKAPLTLTLVARVAGDARNRIAVIRDAVASVDPHIPVFNVKTMEERLDAALARPKFYATAVVFFGGLALLLAVVGVYGMVSCGVMQRTREMGIRIALGTTAGRLRRWLLCRMAVTIALGVVPGLLVVAVIRQGVATLVAGADSAMPGLTVPAVTVTTIVAGIAVWSATRHVARLDVADVMRAECAD